MKIQLNTDVHIDGTGISTWNRSVTVVAIERFSTRAWARNPWSSGNPASSVPDAAFEPTNV